MTTTTPTPTTQALEPNLPELPQMSVGYSYIYGVPIRIEGYTSVQVRAYAITAIEADRNKRAPSPAADAVKLTPYEFTVSGISCEWYLRREVDAILSPKDDGKESGALSDDIAAQGKKPAKTWGLFNKDGTPLALGDEHHKWKCPNQEYRSSGYEHPITGEWVDDGQVEVPCPWRHIGAKQDECQKCGVRFRYP